MHIVIEVVAVLNPKLIHSIAVHEVNPLNDTHSPQYILVDRNIMAQGNSHTGIYRNCFNEHVSSETNAKTRMIGWIKFLISLSNAYLLFDLFLH